MYDLSTAELRCVGGGNPNREDDMITANGTFQYFGGPVVS